MNIMTFNPICGQCETMLLKHNYKIYYYATVLVGEIRIRKNEVLIILVGITGKDGAKQSYSKDNLFEGERLVYATNTEFLNLIR